MKPEDKRVIKLFMYAVAAATFFGIWQNSVAAGAFLFAMLAVLDQRS